MTGPAPRGALSALAAVLLVSAAPQRAGAPLDQKEAERQVVALALAVQKAARAGDAEALLAMVPEDGLPCGGATLPRDRVSADLRTPGTKLHDFFLADATPAAAPGAAPRPSLRRLFGEGRRVKIVVRFTAVEVAKLGWERPCVAFKVEGETYAPRICLLYRSGRYTLAEVGDGC